MNTIEHWINNYFKVSHIDNAITKISLFIFIIAFLPIKSFESLSLVPTYFYTPNPANISFYLFDRIPNELFFKTISILNIGFLFLTFFGRRNFIFGILLCINLTICYAIRNSFGKIDHNYLNIIIFPFLGYFFDKGIKKDKNWALNLLLFLFAFTFLSAGIPKLLDPSYLGWEIQKFKLEMTNHGKVDIINSIENVVGKNSVLFWETMDVLAILFEVLLPLMLFFRVLYIPIFIAFASIFHILNYACFGIFFEGMVYAYVFLLLVLIFGNRKTPVKTNWYISIFTFLLFIYIIINPSILYHKDLIYASRPIFFYLLFFMSITTFILVKKRGDFSKKTQQFKFNASLPVVDPIDNVLFFDGECGFCNSTIQFILSNETDKTLTFSSLQSEYAERFFNQKNININLDTIYFFENDKIYDRSTAFIKLSKHLKRPYSFLSIILLIIPKFIRDWGYNLIAQNRHNLGKYSKYCSIPNEEDKNRFILK